MNCSDGALTYYAWGPRSMLSTAEFLKSPKSTRSPKVTSSVTWPVLLGPCSLTYTNSWQHLPSYQWKVEVPRGSDFITLSCLHSSQMCRFPVFFMPQLLEAEESYDPDLCLPIYHLWETTSGVPFMVDFIMVFHFSLFCWKRNSQRTGETSGPIWCLVALLSTVDLRWMLSRGAGEETLAMAISLYFSLFYLNNADLCVRGSFGKIVL